MTRPHVGLLALVALVSLASIPLSALATTPAALSADTAPAALAADTAPAALSADTAPAALAADTAPAQAVAAGTKAPPSNIPMKAIRFHIFGGPETLVLDDVKRPEPRPGELLVRVHAAGVNPVDWKVRAGMAKALAVLPQIPGYDVSGVVASVGEGVTKFKPGDAVYAMLDLKRGGGYAEYTIVREIEAAPKPRRIDHTAAAAVPLAALTAWQALFDTAKLERGQTVLVHGAAGGVGTFAVQLAKSKGARVIGTASPTNHALLRELGVDETIDYRTTRFEEIVHDVDVVIDTVGGDTTARSVGVLKKGGILVTIAGQPPVDAAKARGVRAEGILVKPDGAELARITRMVEKGTLRPVISGVFPLGQARKAQEMSEGGHTRGKLVLSVGE